MNLTLASDLILLGTLLVFLWQTSVFRRQSRHLAEATRASVYQTICDQMISVDRLFVDQPDLVPFFYRNALLPPPGADRDRVLAAAELFADFMDNVTAQIDHLPDFMAGSWKYYFKSVAANSTAIREFWKEHRDWFDWPLQSVLDDVCLQGSVAENGEDSSVGDEQGGQAMPRSAPIEPRSSSESSARGSSRRGRSIGEGHYDIREGATRYAPIVGGFGALAVPAIILVFIGPAGTGHDDAILRVLAAGLLVVAMIGSLLGAFGFAAIGAENDERANLLAAAVCLAVPVAISVVATLAAFEVLSTIYLSASSTIFLVITALGAVCAVVFASFAVVDAWDVGPTDDRSWAETQWVTSLKRRKDAGFRALAMMVVGVVVVTSGGVARVLGASLPLTTLTAQLVVGLGLFLAVGLGLYGMYRTVYTKVQRGIRWQEALAANLAISLYAAVLLVFLR